jgi:hypothetical protein
MHCIHATHKNTISSSTFLHHRIIAFYQFEVGIAVHMVGQVRWHLSHAAVCCGRDPKLLTDKFLVPNGSPAPAQFA